MSEKTLDISQLSDHLLDLLSDIQNQIQVTLTCEGVPLAKVIPLSVEPQMIPKAGLNRGAMVMSEDFDQPLPDSFWGL
jgi:antitoxin (DNA-binding transcriptional repressor) of toxin-antitoxin stability system